MARTMQTARMSTGGMAPRQPLPRARAIRKRKRRRPPHTDNSVVTVAPVTFRGFDSNRLQVKKRVRVKWPAHHGSSGGWYRGVIRAVYPDIKMVSILYDGTTVEVCDRLNLEWECDESDDEDDKSISDEDEWGKEGVDWGRSCPCGGDLDLPQNPLPFSGIWLFCDSCKFNCGHAECCPQLRDFKSREELRTAAEDESFIWTCPACQVDSDESVNPPPTLVAPEQGEGEEPRSVGHASSVRAGDDAQHPICLE